MGRFGRAVAVVILAAVGQVARNLYHMASPLGKIERLRAASAFVDNSKCALLTGNDDGVVGSEDLVLGSALPPAAPAAPTPAPPPLLSSSQGAPAAAAAVPPPPLSSSQGVGP